MVHFDIPLTPVNAQLFQMSKIWKISITTHSSVDNQRFQKSPLHT